MANATGMFRAAARGLPPASAFLRSALILASSAAVIPVSAYADPNAEVSVYRYQFHIQVQMGHFADFQTLLEELNAALLAKDLVPFKLWEAAFGRFNEFLMVAEYETLEIYEREHFAMHTDPACMNIWRDMATHLDGIPWTDLWSRPPGAS